MRRARISIAGLMGAVLIVALGLAALRSASEISAGVTFLATCAVLTFAVVAASCSGREARAGWLAFSLFGWGYMALALLSGRATPTLPTSILLETVCGKIGMEVPIKVTRTSSVVDPSFTQIGHCLWALLGAVFGGMLATACFVRSVARVEPAGVETGAACPESRQFWRRPVAIALVGTALAGLVAVAGTHWDPGLWAGATFQLTCCLLGLAALGALLAHGKTRRLWLGAALFGFGYMALAFGWWTYRGTCPYLATGRFLDQIRPWFPPRVSGFPMTDDPDLPANAQILKELERDVPFRFATKTTLAEFLKYVRDSTPGPDGQGIRIYVDPAGLQEAEVSMSSTVSLDVYGVPLKTSLRLILKQLDLTYAVKSGFLMITYDDIDLLIEEDAYLTVGHSLFALLFAWLGAAAAMIVARRA
jgi:hypothetical protein